MIAPTKVRAMDLQLAAGDFMRDQAFAKRQNGVKEAIGDDYKCAENFCGVLTFLCYIRPLLNSGTMIFPCFCG